VCVREIENVRETVCVYKDVCKRERERVCVCEWVLKGPVGEVKVVVAATAPVLGPYFTWAHNVTGSTMRTRSRCTYCKVLVTAVHGQCSLAGPLASTG